MTAQLLINAHDQLLYYATDVQQTAHRMYEHMLIGVVDEVAVAGQQELCVLVVEANVAGQGLFYRQVMLGAIKFQEDF